MKKIAISLLWAILSAISTGSQAAEVGSVAPLCDLNTFKSGSPLDLSQYRGKVVYLDFWASWCGPCAQSMPFMNEIDGQLKKQGLEVIGVNLDENREDADAFLARHPVSFTIAASPTGQCPSQFGVMAMPSSYLIDRHGKIRRVQLGFHEAERADIRNAILALLAES